MASRSLGSSRRQWAQMSTSGNTGVQVQPSSLAVSPVLLQVGFAEVRLELVGAGSSIEPANRGRTGPRSTGSCRAVEHRLAGIAVRRNFRKVSCNVHHVSPVWWWRWCAPGGSSCKSAWGIAAHPAAAVTGQSGMRAMSRVVTFASGSPAR